MIYDLLCISIHLRIRNQKSKIRIIINVHDYELGVHC